MKIVYVSYSSHYEIALEPILEVLSERGHQITKSRKDNIPKDTDIVLLTSNAGRPTNLDKHIRTYFIPHGLGMECWEEPMNHDTKVFLAGKKPWVPPRKTKNWKIVGWAKTDVLFHPKKDRVDYVNNLMANLPYDKSVLYIPIPNDLTACRFIIDYFGEQKINVILPYRDGYYQIARGYFKDFKHIALPVIKNLYYFAPHVRVVICVGYSGVSREFYITKIPSIHLIHGYPETLNLSNPNKKNFGRFFSPIWRNPNLFIQPDSVVKTFFGINDGKVTERIVKEIEK